MFYTDSTSNLLCCRIHHKTKVYLLELAVQATAVCLGFNLINLVCIKGPVWGDLSKVKFKIRPFSVARRNVEFHKHLGESAFGEVRKFWRYKRLGSGKSGDNYCYILSHRYGNYAVQRNITVQMGQNDDMNRDIDRQSGRQAGSSPVFPTNQLRMLGMARKCEEPVQHS